MMRLKNIALLFGVLCAVMYCQLVAAEVKSYPEPGNHNLLAADIFHKLVPSRAAENIIFSPISAETALTLTFAGAEGKTAEELRQVLRLGSEDRLRATQNFAEFLKSAIPSNAQAKDSLREMFIANRIYINDNLQIAPDFKRMSEKNFDGLAENLNFAKGKQAADKINNWLEQYTQDKIKNLLLEEDIISDSKMVIVNGIYFKGAWKNSFNEKDIKTAEFHINEKERKPVKMMHIRGTFNYVDLPELEASALELPYNKSGLNMLIVLPYKIEGLERLEEKLKDLEFNYIPSRLAPQQVCACVPKLQLEQDIDLKQPLEKIGLTTLFSEKAEFPGMFELPSGQYISTFKQKTVFEIDEKGAEPAIPAAGATGECGKDYASFYADHPFIFAVRTNSVIYFGGHVARL